MMAMVRHRQYCACIGERDRPARSREGHARRVCSPSTTLAIIAAVPSPTDVYIVVRSFLVHFFSVCRDHGYVRYHSVRVPLDHMLGRRGAGFLVAQTRLSGGRRLAVEKAWAASPPLVVATMHV